MIKFSQSLIIILLLVVLIIICSQQIYLNEPRNNHVYTINESNNNVYNTLIRYQIYGNIDNSNDIIEICLKILTIQKIEYLSQTCLKYNINESMLTIEKMIPNQYILVMGIKKNDIIIQDSIIETNFTINRLVDSLPRISFFKGLDALYYAKSEDISIEYFLSISKIPLSNIQICLKVLNSVGVLLYDFFCMEITYKKFNLKNIDIGNYQLVLILANKRNSYDIEYYKDTEVNTKLHINTIENYIPNFKFSNLQYEAVVDKFTSVTKIIVPFIVEEKALNVIDQLEMCIKLNNTDLSTTIFSQCSSSLLISPLSLSNLQVGNFILILSFINKKTKFIYDMTTTQVKLIVHYPQEFTPTYDFKIIEIYESIPSGLEVIMPLDGMQKKMGRIPSPWRIMLPMPTPCKFFLRMDIYKDTLIQEILKYGEKLCHLSDNCLSLISDQIVIDHYATAESSNLFNINKTLKINEKCI